MARTPTGPSERRFVLDHLVACFWWLLFLGGVGAGVAVGVILALWLTLPALPGLFLIVACWIAGNTAGWWFAAWAEAALAQRLRKQRKRIDAALTAPPNRSYRGVLRPQGTGWCRSLGPVCP